jgi:HAD superfamily phosphoserine phosphatase-like hydrolase
MEKRLLEPQEIYRIYEAAVSAGLAESQHALLRGLDPVLVASLPHEGTPAAELLSTLNVLNGADLGDGSVPLRVWLEHAKQLSARKVQRSIFERALEATGVAPGSDQPPVLAPPIDTWAGPDRAQVDKLLEYFVERRLLQESVEIRPLKDAIEAPARDARIGDLVEELRRQCGEVKRGDVVMGIRLEEVLRKGAGSTLWRGVDLDSEMPRVVKVFDFDRFASDVALHAFIRGVRALEALRDAVGQPGTASTALVLAAHPSGLAYAMPLYAHGNLHARVAASGELDIGLEGTLQIFKQVCEAARAAHRLGIVHRNIQPSNVLLDKRDHVFLTDFESADMGEPRRIPVPSGDLDSVYTAPETTPASGAAATADIFSLGRLLQFLLRRRAPSSSAARDLAEQRYEYRRLVMKATAEDPADRFADVSALLTALAAAKKKRWPPASYRIPLILAVVIACLGAGIGYLVRPRPTGLTSNTRDALAEMLKVYGSGGDLYSAAQPPLAVLDFDNTVISRDCGDLSVYWMLHTDRIKTTAVFDTAKSFLTSVAQKVLEDACRPAKQADHLITANGGPCAEAIWAIYSEAKLGGENAFENDYDHRYMMPQYAWGAQLFSGHTPDEVREIARQARDAKIKDTVRIGTLDANLKVVYRDDMNTLIESLKKRGFDVWILSASPQYVVEVFAERAGFDKDHVIGIQQVIEHGVLSSKLVPCDDKAVIPFRIGKVCWMKKKIRAERDPEFAAGDSETDLELLKTATVLKLAFDRHRAPLMCSALNGSGPNKNTHKWLVNAPFPEEPLTTPPPPYTCTTDCHGEDGGGVPCMDENDAGIVNNPSPKPPVNPVE